MKKAIPLLFVSIFCSQMNSHVQEVQRSELQRCDLTIPQKVSIQAIISFAPGAMFPRHSHPGEELIYLLEGEIEYVIDGKKPRILKAGDVLFIPAYTFHKSKKSRKCSRKRTGNLYSIKG